MPRSTRFLSIIALVAWGIVSRPEPAAAQTQLYLNVPGITAVGTIGGRTVAATFSLFGCTFQDLAPATFTTDYDLHGTPFNDTINVISAPTSWCNIWLQPINFGIHHMRTYGGAGDDVIYGGGASMAGSGNPNWIFGEAGNDILYLGPGGVEGDGGDGNDKIYGSDNSNDLLIGGNGNDALCTHATKPPPLWQDGGAGTDSVCSHDQLSCGHCEIISIETFSCSPCGFGY